MNVTIRNATAADLPSLAAIYVAAFIGVDSSERWTAESANGLLSFFLRAQPDLAFVAVADEQLVGGICGIAKPWWDGHHLVQTEIFLSPEFQRCGIGQALFRNFVTVARNRYNAIHMESITFKNLAFPSSWYTKLGFQEKDDWKVVIGAVDLLAERLNMNPSG